MALKLSSNHCLTRLIKIGARAKLTNIEELRIWMRHEGNTVLRVFLKISKYGVTFLKE
jgi:hypothetical protein